MKITLKNIKHSAFASQETHCFEAVIYIDGKRFCHVQNDGHGGSDDYYALNESTMSEMWDQINEINAELGKEKLTTEYGEGKSFTVSNSLEIVVGDLMNDHLTNKQAKRIYNKAMKSGVSYVEDSAIYQIKCDVNHEESMIQIFNRLHAKNGSVEIINLMNPEKAIERYKELVLV